MGKTYISQQHISESDWFTHKCLLDHADVMDLEDPPPKKGGIQNNRTVFTPCVAPGILTIFLGKQPIVRENNHTKQRDSILAVNHCHT